MTSTLEASFLCFLFVGLWFVAAICLAYWGEDITAAWQELESRRRPAARYACEGFHGLDLDSDSAQTSHDGPIHRDAVTHSGSTV